MSELKKMSKVDNLYKVFADHLGEDLKQMKKERDEALAKLQTTEKALLLLAKETDQCFNVDPCPDKYSIPEDCAKCTVEVFMERARKNG